MAHSPMTHFPVGHAGLSTPLTPRMGSFASSAQPHYRCSSVPSYPRTSSSSLACARPKTFLKGGISARPANRNSAILGRSPFLGTVPDQVQDQSAPGVALTADASYSEGQTVEENETEVTRTRLASESEYLDAEEDEEVAGDSTFTDEELERLRSELGPELEALMDEEDWEEEELDDLFDRFGQVISESSAGPTEVATPAQQSKSAAPGRPNGEEPPTDADSELLAVALAAAASDTKAGSIRVLDVRPLVYWTQYFVIATAFSRPQMDAMAKRISDVAEGQYRRQLKAQERAGPGPWTLLDYGDVVVHLFAPRERERYAIEEFYANAREVPLPFEQVPVNQY